MKQNVCCGNSHSLLLLLLCFFLYSCGSVQRFRQDVYAARDTEKKSFVEKRDGTVIEADEAMLRTPLFGKSSIELDRNTKIPTKEIDAYQNNSGYYRRVEGMFAPRIKKGLINMYITTETYQEYSASGAPGGMGRWRAHTRTVYHMQKGDASAVVRFTPNVTRNYVQEYAPAMEFINVYDANRRKGRIWSYINTAATLGGLALLMTKGINSKDEVTTAGYAGTGLFFGGLVNGVVNKFRKARNYKNLELAIDTYNGQVLKKKRKQ